MAKLYHLLPLPSSLGKLITSTVSLGTHKKVCHETDSFNCSEWCKECNPREELGQHVKAYHETFSDGQGGGADVKSCDFCGFKF